MKIKSISCFVVLLRLLCSWPIQFRARQRPVGRLSRTRKSESR